MRNRCMFEKMATGIALAAAVMAGAAMLPGSGHGLVVEAYAADVNNRNSQNISGGGTRSKDEVDKTNETSSKEGDAEAGAENGEGIYDFKDNKTTGTVTITKKWDDGLTNAEREIPDMYLSTEKPSKSTKGYTITFHGNGLKFADGADENMVVYNSSGQIVEGSYKEVTGTGVGWYSDEACKNRVMISDDGVPQVELTGDLDLWAKEMTFTLVDGFSFSGKVPKNATEVIFTDEAKPKEKETINVDADGDGGVVAWLDDDTGTVMKVSTQTPGLKVQAAIKSGYMFSGRSNLQKIDLEMLDTQNVTSMCIMFYNCSGLTSLDLSSLNTQNVTDMSEMFRGCSGLTSLDLTPLDTQNVTDMSEMFKDCSGLTSLDLSPLDTSKVTNMSSLFYQCRRLTSLDLTSLDTQNVTNMSYMFSGCSSLTSLDLTPLDTQKVTRMDAMFSNCSGLTSLDLRPLDTQNVTNMGSMFFGCSGLTGLDLTPLDTQNVTAMSNMFYCCSGLTSLDLTPLDTHKVKYMGSMFFGCSGLTSLNLTSLNTQNVTRMDGMFYGCSNLVKLDLSSFDTSNVTTMGGSSKYNGNSFSTYGQSGMFEDCSSLASLIIPFNTSHVTDFGMMFKECDALTTLDISTFDTTAAKNMSSMFDGCKNLTNIDLSKVNTKNVTSLNGMFNNCNSLKSLDLSSFDTSNVTDMVYMFNNCTSLTSLTTGTAFKFVGTKYDLYGTWQNTAGETFNGNYNTANFPSNVADTYTKISS